MHELAEWSCQVMSDQFKEWSDILAVHHAGVIMICPVHGMYTMLFDDVVLEHARNWLLGHT